MAELEERVLQGRQDAGVTLTVTSAGQVDSYGVDFIPPTSGETGYFKVSPRYASSSAQTCTPPYRTQSSTEIVCGVCSTKYYPQNNIPEPPSVIQNTNMASQQSGIRSNMNNRASEAGRAIVPVDPSRQRRQTPVRDTQMRPTNNAEERRAALRSSGSLASRGGDSFAESLRRYQSLVKRSTSADLIQRLLAYTQTKNLTKSSYHSKSLRSLARPSRETKREETRETVVIKRSSKNIQTYTRTRNESPVADGGYGKVERRRRLNSPQRGASSSSRPRDLSSSYDYLKIGNGSFQRSTDVRYFNDVTRFVRDTLRQIYEEESPVCPQIMSRYRQHRRSYHSNEASTTTIPTEKSQIVQTTPRRVSMHLPCAPPCVAPGQMTQTPLCCDFCHSPLPCNCPEALPEIKPDCLDYCSSFLLNLCPSEDSSDDDCPCSDIYDSVVNDWLKLVPVSAFYRTQEKQQRKQLANHLKDKLREFENDEEKSIEEIMKCLNVLPMWLPPDKNAHQAFRQDLAKQLMRDLSVKKIDRDKYNAFIENWLKSIPFKESLPIDKEKLAAYLTDKLVDVSSKTDPSELKDVIKDVLLDELRQWPIEVVPKDKDQLLDALAEDLADSIGNKKFNDVIYSFVNALPLRLSYEPIDKFKLASKLKKTTQDLIATSPPGELTKNITEAISRELDALPIRLFPLQKDILAKKLSDDIVSLNLPSTSSTAKKTALYKSMKPKVLNWLEEIPEFRSNSEEDYKQNKQIAKSLANQLAKIVANDPDDGIVRKKMVDEIKSKLDQSLAEKGIEMDDEKKNRLAEQLLDKLLGPPDNASFSSTLSLDEVVDLLENIPVLAATTSKEKLANEQLTKDLAARLHELKLQGLDDDEIEKIMMSEIKNKLDSTLDKKGESLDPEVKKQLAQQLLGKLKEAANKPTSLEKKIEKAMENAAKKDVEAWLDKIPELAGKTPSEQKANKKLIDEIAKTVTQLKAELRAAGFSDAEIEKRIRSEIGNRLGAALEERGVSMDPKTKEKLAQQLVGTLEATEDNVMAAVADKAAAQVANVAKEDIKKILDGFPELAGKTPAEQKANEKMTEELAKTLTKLRAEGLDDEEIKKRMQAEVMKKLDETLSDRGQTMDPETKEKLAQQLLGKLETTANKVLTSDGKTATRLANAAKQDVKELLDGIPELAGRTQSQQKANEKLAEDLAKTLTKLKAEGLDHAEIKKRMQAEVMKKLEATLNERGETIDPNAKEKIAQQLLGKLEATANKVLPSDDKATQLANAAKQDVKKILDDIPELAARTPSQQRANEKMTEDLAKTLTKLKAEGLDDEEIKKRMQAEVMKKLEETLGERGETMDPKAKEKLAQQLIGKLETTANKVLPPADTNATRLANAAKQDVTKLLDDIPELAGRTPSQQKANEKMTEDLAMTLTKLKAEGLDDEEIKKRMQVEVMKKLEATLGERGESMDPKAKEKLAQQLLGKLETTANKVLPSDTKAATQLANAAKQDVKKILDDIPELAGRTPSQQKANEKMTEDLAKTLTKLKAEGLNDEEIKKRMQAEVLKKLEATLDERGQTMDPKAKEKLAQQLLGKLETTANKVLPSDTKAATQLANAAKQDVEKILDDIPELAGKTPALQRANEKLTEDLANTLMKLKAEGLDDAEIKKRMQAEVMKKLEATLGERGETMDPKAKAKLAQQLLGKLESTANKMVPPSDKAAAQLANAAKQDVAKLLDGIPELAGRTPSQQKANEKMTEDLANTLMKLKAEGLDDAEIKKRMQAEVMKNLEATLQERGETMDPTAKEKLAQQLLGKLEMTANKVLPPAIKTEGVAAGRASEQKENKGLPATIKRERRFSVAGLPKEDKQKPSTKDFFKEFAELKATNANELKENKQAFHELETRLTDLKAQGYNDAQVKEKITPEVKGKVEHLLEERGLQLDEYSLGVLTENVLGMMFNPDSLKEEIETELQEAAEALSSSSMQIDLLSKKLALLVKELHGSDKNPESVREHLGSAFDKGKESSDTKTKNRSPEHIMLVLENKKMHEPPKLYEEKVFECIEKIPELSSNSYLKKKQNKVLSYELAKELFDLQSKVSDDDNVKLQMLKKVKSLLDIALEDKSEYSDLKYRIADKLLSSIIDSTKNIEKPNRLASKFQGKVNDFSKKVSELSIRRSGPKKEVTNLRSTSQASISKSQSKGKRDTGIRDEIIKNIVNPVSRHFRNKWTTLASKSKTSLGNKMNPRILATKLSDRFNKSSKSTDKFVSKVLQNLVLKWLEDIPELMSCTLGDRRENEEGSRALAFRLAVLLSKNNEETRTRHEMLKTIKEHLVNAFEMKSEEISFAVKTNLAYKLLQQVLALAKVSDEACDVPFEEVSSEGLLAISCMTKNSQLGLIWDWFCKTPMFSANNKAENMRMVEKLNVTLQNIQERYVDDDTKYREMKNKIIGWLNEAIDRKEYKLNSTSIEKCARNLLDTIKPATRNLKQISSDIINVSDFLTSQDIEEFSCGKSVSKNNNKYEFKSNTLAQNSGNLNDVRPIIFGDFRNYRFQSNEEAHSLNRTNESRLYPGSSNNKYMKTVKVTNFEFIRNQKRPNAHFTDEQPEVYLLEELNEEAPDKPRLSQSKSLAKKVTKVPEAIQVKMTNMIAKNIDQLMTPRGEGIKRQLIDLLTKEAGLTIAEAKELVYLTLRRVQIKFLENGSEEMELLALLREEFKEVIDELDIPKERQAELETYLADLGFQKLLNDELPVEFLDEEKEEILNNIIEIIDVSKLSAQEFAEECYKEMKALSSSPTVIKWVNLLLTGARSYASLTLKQQCRFEKQGYGIMKNFIIENKNMHRFSHITTIDDAIRTALGNIIDYLSSPDLNGAEKRRLMKNELAQELHTTLHRADVNELAEELLDRLEYINLKVRQPRFSKAEPSPDNINAYYASYLVNSLTDDESEIPVASSTRTDDEAQRRRDSEIRKNKRQYENKLEEVINDWFDKLPPEVGSDDPNYRNTLIDDLVGDIVDTQKYRQLNPDVDVPEAEEIDNLRYQCFNWMGKFLEGENLKTAMAKGDELVDAIKGVVALPLVDPSERRASLRSSKGQIPTYTSALQKAVSNWIQGLPPSVSPTVDENHMKQLISDFAGRVAALKGEPDAEDKIRKKISNFLPIIFGSRDKEELKQLGASLFDVLKEKGFADFSWIPTDTSQLNEENVEGVVQDMMKVMPHYLTSNPQEKKVLDDVANEMAKGLKKVDQSYDAIKSEVMKHTKHFADPEIKNNDKLLNIVADGIIVHLKSQGAIQAGESVPTLPFVIDEWVKTIPLEGHSPEEQKQVDNLKNALVNQVTQVRKQHHPSTSQHEDGIKDEAMKFLNAISPYSRLDDTEMDDKANELTKLLRYVPLQAPKDKSVKKFKRPADVLFEYVEEWCDNLPVHADPDKEQAIKQGLAIKLINRIGELNMNPDIFNDKVLYEDLLHDEIDKMLDEVPRNPELDKYLPALKKDLVSKIMEAREQMYNELVGKAYKQQLRDTVSTTMGLPENLSPDEQASFELLKDKVADAFINLHYSPSLPCNDELRNIYRQKISDEVDRFCEEVLNHYPCSRLDPSKIKRDLNKALVRIPVPKDDSMKIEVEQSRLKDIVTDWMKEIPLRQETATDRFRRYKLATVLVKNLHELEMMKEADPYSDLDEKTQEEIVRFLRKLPFIHGQEGRIPELAQDLVRRLLESNVSRKFISARRSKSIESRAEVCTRYPCTLSQTDREHLTRIRERQSRPPCYKEIATCAPMKSACSQTEPAQCAPQRSCTPTHYAPTKLIAPPVCSKRDATCMTAPSRTGQANPQILVREYIWDSPDSPKPCTGMPPTMTRSCSQGVQSGQPYSSSSAAQQTCPYARPATCPEAHQPSYSQAPQRPSYATNPPQPCPLIQPCPQPYHASQQTSQPYSAPHPCPGHQYQTPQRAESRPQIYCPQEKKVHCGSKFFQHTSPEASSGEEGGSHKSYCGPRGQGYSCSNNCKRRPDPETEWSEEEFWDTCEKLRGRHTDVPCSRRRERVEEKSRCRCKDRILVSCKGLNNKNRFHDMCQNCGSNCPHPTNLFFKR